MCCLFGIMDYGDSLTVRQRTNVLSVLATSCEVRGIDATGIAYNTDSHLTIFKRPLAAHKMWFRLPKDANVIMGHTRMSTQGDKRFNYNNHPFWGKAGKTSFALAHNGVLYNDTQLQKKYRLPKTNIETDSYVAVQMLERHADLSFASLATVAEELEGSFTLSLLDDSNSVYFIKGNNPLCLYYWRERNLYIYASTEEILKPALSRIPYKLGELEETKEKLLFELNDVESSLKHDEFSEEKIRKLFSKAEHQLKNGTLANRRMIIDQYIDKVVIYKDRIEVYMNLVGDYVLKEVIEQ